MPSEFVSLNAACCSRKNKLLTKDDISELREACRASPTAIFAAYPKRKYLAAKTHFIERYLVFFVPPPPSGGDWI